MANGLELGSFVARLTGLALDNLEEKALVSNLFESIKKNGDHSKNSMVFGDTPVSQMFTYQVLSTFAREMSGQKLENESQLRYILMILNDILERASFLASPVKPTIADFVVFFKVHCSKSFSKIKQDELVLTYTNFARWFDFMQNTPELADFKLEQRLKLAFPDVFAEMLQAGSENNAPIPRKRIEKGEKAKEDVDKKITEKLSKKQTKIKNTKEANVEELQPAISKLDIRVGKILKIEKHPEKDKLYCEEIDLNEKDGPRPIASGLVEHYPDKDVLLNRKVLVLCNLKPRKMGSSFKSNGMVLCASSEDKSKVEVLDPPEDAEVGERVLLPSVKTFDRYKPLPPNKIAKLKVFESVAPFLKTNAERQACWIDDKGESHRFETSKGYCTAKTIASGNVS